MVNEKRLIDVNKLRGLKYEKVKFSDYREGWNDAIDTICTETFLPSVDAVEVVHGRWIGREEKLWNLDMPIVTMWECSVCGMSGGYYEYNYCPNCGAKMDK